MRQARCEVDRTSPPRRRLRSRPRARFRVLLVASFCNNHIDILALVSLLFPGALNLLKTLPPLLVHLAYVVSVILNILITIAIKIQGTYR